MSGDRFGDGAASAVTTAERRLAPETLAARGMPTPDPETGAVVPPIHLASTFARDADYELRQPFSYARDGGPTSRTAEWLIRDLERAERTLLFSSGLSAMAAVLEALPMGARIAIPDRMYHGGRSWARRLEAIGRIRIDVYRSGDAESLNSAVHPGQTSLVWIETPSNPECRITDIRCGANAAKAADTLLLVDSTAAPPPTTTALDLGANIAFHSGTKYLNGHSDVTAGVLSFRNARGFDDEVAGIRTHQGTVLPGFESWLLLRGLRTLFVRFGKMSASAQAIGEALSDHPRVEVVHYPGLPGHPGHTIAAGQMTGGFGGMLSFQVRGGARMARAVALGCRLFVPATSLGGTESLIEHRKSIEGADSPVPDTLLRLSVGLEDARDLIADIDQALAKAI